MHCELMKIAPLYASLLSALSAAMQNDPSPTTVNS
jgi:hypothetical protein